MIQLSKGPKVLEVDLVQPRHNYAPPHGKGHPYMPGPLLTEGARLDNAGVDINVIDGNLMSILISLRSHFIGINLLGAPYIPEVIKLQREIDKETNGEAVYLLGGQVISGLTPEQFRRLFGERAYNGNDDRVVEQVLGLRMGSLIPPERTSLIDVYKKLPDEVIREYLSNEFSLYVSQGCKFSCRFCAAVRTVRDPLTGELKTVKETYRDVNIIERDLEYLVKRAIKLGINEFNIYMSNLDVFQTPTELLKFAYAVENVKSKYPGFRIKLRGLSTVECYLETREANAHVIEKLVEVGFHTVGFGVDGMTPLVWKANKKGFNTEEKCITSIQSCRPDFGITPEVLMVFGHVGVDTEETLRLAYEFTVDMAEMYGAIPRPHVAKSFIPGNDGWSYPENKKAIELMLRQPILFQGVDFTALPSELTHPDDKFRASVIYYYDETCSIPGNTTKPVKPIGPGLTPEQIEQVNKDNEGQYDH